MDWIIFALVAAFIGGFQDILKKRVLKKEHSFEYLSLVYASYFLLLLPLVSKANFHLPFNLVALILVRSFFMLIAVVAATKALKHLPISTVAPLSNFKSLFALLLGFVFLNETIGSFQILGVMVIIAGAYVLDSEGHIRNYHKPLHDLVSSKYIHYLLIFAVFHPATAVLSKVILRDVDPFNLMFYHAFFSTIMYLSITFGFYGGMDDLKEGWNLAGYWIVLIALIGIFGVYSSFLAYAATNSKVILIVPILQLSTLISVIFGGKCFHESYIGIKAVGCILMVCGVALLFI